MTETLTLVVERDLAHSQDKVWRALTQGRLIEDWLMPNDFEPVVGKRFQFRSQPMPPHWDGIIDCEVTAVEPQTRLAYRWAAKGLDTVVTWTLTPMAGGVHLHMEQSGFDPAQQNYFQGANYGWQKFIGQLETLVARLD